jgi:Ca2+:H+ antiporter
VTILYAFVLLVPITVALHLAGASHSLVFAGSALSLVPLSALIGKSTEELAHYSGPRIGGLLNVTMGNAAEMIIALAALHEGLTDLVKASIAGSILSNALLVLGASALVGGLKNGRQRFDPHVAGISGTMFILAVVALSLEGIFATGPHAVRSEADQEAVSIGIAIVLLAVYGLYVAYAVFFGSGSKPEQATEEKHWSLMLSIGVLAAATVGAIVMSELLVARVEEVIDKVGITEIFLGVILVPIIGNAAEHWSAITAAHRNDMELSLAISVGSSLQVAVFVAPVLVLAGFAVDDRLHLIFNQYELAALVGAASITALVAMDGESNWIEGAQLLAVYAIYTIGFFFLT